MWFSTLKQNGKGKNADFDDNYACFHGTVGPRKISFRRLWLIFAQRLSKEVEKEENKPSIKI